MHWIFKIELNFDLAWLNYYSAYSEFRHASLTELKLCYTGLILGSSQFLPLPKVCQKMTLASKVVKSEFKLITSIHISLV